MIKNIIQIRRAFFSSCARQNGIFKMTNLKSTLFSVAANVFPAIKGEAKVWSEFSYWRDRKAAEGSLSNRHYEEFYTTQFGLRKSFYDSKRILDIGCGPRGSLEWADNAAERIGLDPLADRYRDLGIEQHQMQYVSAPSEKIPFPDEHFDVVCSFNSLDHVNNLQTTVHSIIRVLKRGGIFLLLTELNHHPTAAEPIKFSWDITEKFAPPLKLLEEKHYEKQSQLGMYQNLLKNVSYDHSVSKRRVGILSAKFTKL